MKRTLTFATLLLAGFSALAATSLYGGTTVGGPTWTRPVANGNVAPTPPASGVGTAVSYDDYAFSVSLSGSYSFQSTATAPAGWDNYTFLYIDSFNPASPFTNVLIGNDDNPTTGLSGFTLNLLAGRTYFLITTGFANLDAGSFSTSIDGPGVVRAAVVNPTPEPATLALLGVALAGLSMSRVGRRRTA